MGLLDDLGSAWNAIEHAGETVFHDLEEVVSHLASLGVPSFASLKSFIEFLVREGENPFTFIPNMVSEIISRGGSVVDTLEQVASGFIHEGPGNYVSRLTRQKIDPIITTVQQHTSTANALGTLHQSTLTQVQNKLTTLSQGGNGTIPFQGKAANAIQTHFTTVSGNVNKLITPMTGGGGSASSLGYDTADPWASFQDTFGSINQTFIDGLNEIPNIVKSFSKWELALVAIAFVIGLAVAVETAGVGDVVDLGVTVVAEAVLLIAEIAVIAVWFIGDCLLWLGRVIVALIVLGIEEIIYHTQAHSTAIPYPDRWVLPDGIPLPNEMIPRAKSLWDQYKGKIGKALTASIIAYLALYCSVSVAQKLLDNWDLFGPVLEKLNATDKGDVLEAEALINAIVRIGPQNVKSLGLGYPWTNPDGSPVINNGKRVNGDIDIVTRYNPPWFVEVGPYTKGDAPAHFVNQLTQLKRYADSQKPPGTAKFYMQMPSVPMTPNQANSMGGTLTIARRILDGQNITTTVDPTTGEIIPPLTTQNIVVMGRPESNCTVN